MDMGYTKLFSSIVTSTIWVESDRTRIVWITMLAIADKNGEVQASIPGLARLAGVPIADCEEAIRKFLTPDPYSRTPDDEGRRIEQIDGGWALLNHAKYRQMASKEDSKRDAAERQRRHRDKLKRNAPVTGGHASVTHQADIAEAKADTQAEASTAKAVGRTAARSCQLPDDEWIKSLENDPTYQDLNIRQELGKMQRWCETNRQKPSRKRFVNWLNRAEKPIGVYGHRQPKHAAYDAKTATLGLTAEQIGTF